MSPFTKPLSWSLPTLVASPVSLARRLSGRDAAARCGTVGHASEPGIRHARDADNIRWLNATCSETLGPQSWRERSKNSVRRFCGRIAFEVRVHRIAEGHPALCIQHEYLEHSPFGELQPIPMAAFLAFPAAFDRQH